MKQSNNTKTSLEKNEAKKQLRGVTKRVISRLERLIELKQKKITNQYLQ